MKDRKGYIQGRIPKKNMDQEQKWKRIQFPKEEEHASEYLIAGDEEQEEWRKELLYRIMGPVFFGKKEAESWQELSELFMRRYGIDVEHDFYEGDEHYEEYQEAKQAIAEGMSIYSGAIAFDENRLAEYAETLWENMEQSNQKKFRRINTMLEE